MPGFLFLNLITCLVYFPGSGSEISATGSLCERSTGAFVCGSLCGQSPGVQSPKHGEYRCVVELLYVIPSLIDEK